MRKGTQTLSDFERPRHGGAKRTLGCAPAATVCGEPSCYDVPGITTGGIVMRKLLLASTALAVVTAAGSVGAAD